MMQAPSSSSTVRCYCGAAAATPAYATRTRCTRRRLYRIRHAVLRMV